MSITLTTTTSGYNLQAINDNFSAIQTALNNSIVWKTGSVAGEAQMQRDLDMNGHSLLNLAVDVDDEGSLLTVGVADSRYVNADGDAMTGPLAMGSNKITGLANGTADADAATYGQLEDESDYRSSADASLQAQISGLTPVLIEERPVVQYHSNTLANSFDIPAEMNAFSIGPQITIEPGQTVTLGENSYWSILGNVFEADELYNVTANNLTTSDAAHTVAVADIDSVITGTGTVAVTGGTITGITDLAVADGGTGASTASGARTNLGAAASGANTDITSITGSAATLTTARTVQTNLASTSSASFDGSANITPGVTGTLPITNGGTGATTAAAARTALGAAASAGVTDASVAAAGVVGEVLTATGTSTAITSATAMNGASLALTAGDWEAYGVVELIYTGTTSATAIIGALSTTSASQGAFPARYQRADTISSPGTMYFQVPHVEFNVSAATTIYLGVYTVFTGGTATARAYIKARRIR